MSSVRPATRPTTWEELLRPGRREPYFAADPRPPLAAEATGYDSAQAWWLAELSRLTYRRSGRDGVLRRVGLAELHRFADRSTRCSVFAPRDTKAPSFAAVVFEGSNELRDWLINFDAKPTAWSAGGCVHQGFARALRGLWGPVAAWVAQAPQALLFAGHSLGGALATLAASLHRPRAVYTFGAPMVGDRAFAAAVAGVPLYRVVFHRDVVPTVPGETRGFCHQGTLYYVSGTGAMLVDPPPSVIAADHDASRREAAATRDWRDWLRPAAPLGDHAPTCYVDALCAELTR